MQSFTFMCLLVLLLLFFHPTQRSVTADHEAAAKEVRSDNRNLKRLLHDFHRDLKRRNDCRYGRKGKLSVQLDTQLLVERVCESRERSKEKSVEWLKSLGR
uniref:Conotoxin superfamily conantokin n=1 Tax=Conus magus TaxID=6492 RepID=A0A5P8I0H5_CONMA|nr:conotoxin superfamily conantokin [Conus magus]